MDKGKAVIECAGYWSDTTDGRDFSCEYEYAGRCACDHCLVNGGECDPRYPGEAVAVNWSYWIF